MNLFDDFLKILSKSLNLPNLYKDAFKSCLLSFNNDEIKLLIEYDESLVPNNILLSSEIISISDYAYLQILQESLIENYSIPETLSMIPLENVLTIHRRIPPVIDPTDLKAVIDHFVEQITKWRIKVKQIESNPKKELKIPTPPSHLQIFPFRG